MKNRDIHAAIRVLKKEVAQWRVPAVGHYTQTPFTVLISCILSLRTQDKTTDAASKRLFKLARTPKTMVKLAVKTIEETIYPVGFYKTKAVNIKKICDLLLSQDKGRVPDDIDELLKLPGVGRKTANLVITLHRISNRWGYVKTKTPEQTEMALREKLPPEYWIMINDLLVSFGQNLCKPISPFCSQCKIKRYCDRVGVKVSR